MNEEQKISLGKQMFPEPVATEQHAFYAPSDGSTGIVITPENPHKGWDYLNASELTLISFAHPVFKDLLGVCKALLFACEKADLEGDLSAEIDGALLDDARAAIAKAEGREP